MQEGNYVWSSLQGLHWVSNEYCNLVVEIAFWLSWINVQTFINWRLYGFLKRAGALSCKHGFCFPDIRLVSCCLFIECRSNDLGQ